MSAKRKRRPPARPQSRTLQPALRSREDEAKRHRREEAHRLRETTRRRMARRRRNRVATYWIVGIIAVGGLAFLATRPKHGAPLSASETALLSEAGAQAQAAGCGAVQSIHGYSGGNDRSHIGSQVATAPPLSSYPSTPPASGPHDNSTLAAGVYESPPSIYSAIHSLEHGAVVIWYAPSASDAELSRIKDFFSDPAHNDHVIVAPYSYPDQGAAGGLPSGTDMVLVAWHPLRACGRLNPSVAFDFVAHYRFPAPP